MPNTFWRNHGRARAVILKKSRRTHPAPERGSVAAVRALMQELEQTPTDDGTPRARFSFAAGDVIEIYRHKADEGAGVWFRLKSGQIIDQYGEARGTDAGGYDTDQEAGCHTPEHVATGPD